MVQVAEKFIETVVSRQKFVLIPKVILAKLTGSITLGFEHFSDGDIAVL